MTTSPDQPALRIVLHAPTVAALARARSNATNLQRGAPYALVRIVVNAEAVAAALDQPHAEVDGLTQVCGNTLQRLGRQAHAPLAVLAQGAVLALAEMQRDGWNYIRA
ncbi:hypothetical protein [Azohydromonas caseinilytica]|uniref:Intracellular sulfur oxidation protein, DsrE/DsrF family n=1 Tax=Azohydromonas caseinilytica TaxID=2728836 RepID=A0A848FK67_9BURK|nr:hypothetical protein [Azohydromonas caseinilytica]NML18191.1 hypothetical protein [Azohydromonas caseinilytica]